jgi:hypothetical protein
LFTSKQSTAQFFAVPAAHADTNCETNFGHSGIAWTGGSVALVAPDDAARVVLVASDNDDQGGNLYYFWQQAGTGDWHRELVADANGGSCPGNCAGWCPVTPWGYVSNAITWTGRMVAIAGLDQRDGGLYFWWQPVGWTAWFPQIVASGPPGCCNFGSVENGQVTPKVLGYSMPSIAWAGGSVVIAACDQSHDLHYWFQQMGRDGLPPHVGPLNWPTGTWYHQLVAKGDCYGQPTIAWTGLDLTALGGGIGVPGSVVIAAPCPGGICYWWQAVGTRPWNRQVVDDSAGAASPSIAWTGNAVLIAATHWNGTRNAIVYWWQAVGTRPWHKQEIASRDNNGEQGIALQNPAIADADGSVVIADGQAALNNNGLNYWWAPAKDSGVWTQQTPTQSDTNADTDPRVIAWTGRSVVISSVTNCGDLDYWWQAKATTDWNHQRVSTNPNWPPGDCGSG